MKILDDHIVDNSIYFVLTPFVCDLLQYSLTCHRYSCRRFLTQNHMTWRHWNVIFSKKKSNLIWFFRQCVKLMYNKILKVWCRHLTWFSSYREYSRGGFSPPAGRGIHRRAPTNFQCPIASVYISVTQEVDWRKTMKSLYVDQKWWQCVMFVVMLPRFGPKIRVYGKQRHMQPS